MIKNYISKFRNINPVYLIDFSISEKYVLIELKKFSKEEIRANIDYLFKRAIYFNYEKVFLFLKNETFSSYRKTGREEFLQKIEKYSYLKKYVA